MISDKHSWVSKMRCLAIGLFMGMEPTGPEVATLWNFTGLFGTLPFLGDDRFRQPEA